MDWLSFLIGMWVGGVVGVGFMVLLLWKHKDEEDSDV